MGRRLKKARLTLINIWNTYPYRYDTNSPYYCTQKMFCDVNKDFNRLISELVLQGYSYKVPSQGGYIRIKKFRTTKSSPDWYLTNLHYGEENKLLPKGEKKLIMHRNKHSDGWAGRWWWDMGKCWRNARLYRFKPTRYNARQIAKQINNNNLITSYLQ
jgi:hypothetical protein